MRKLSVCIYKMKGAVVAQLFSTFVSPHQELNSFSSLYIQNIANFSPSSLTEQASLCRTWPRDYKLFFMFSSAETKIYPAHKC